MARRRRPCRDCKPSTIELCTHRHALERLPIPHAARPAPACFRDVGAGRASERAIDVARWQAGLPPYGPGTRVVSLLSVPQRQMSRSQVYKAAQRLAENGNVRRMKAGRIWQYWRAAKHPSAPRLVMRLLLQTHRWKIQPVFFPCPPPRLTELGEVILICSSADIFRRSVGERVVT
jgi:hypothetical protein